MKLPEKTLFDWNNHHYTLLMSPFPLTAPFSPREVYTHILGYMHEIAVSHATAETEDKNTVLTVPLDMSEETRRACAECARKAGFNVVQVVSEPAAACLAYGLGQLDTQESFHALVYR